jgi:hypothetical protein
MIKSSIFLFSALTGSAAATAANACPPCPTTAKYCINNSHCEPNEPDLLTLQSAITVNVEGKSFIMGPEDKLQKINPN